MSKKEAGLMTLVTRHANKRLSLYPEDQLLQDLEAVMAKRWHRYYSVVRVAPRAPRGSGEHSDSESGMVLTLSVAPEKITELQLEIPRLLEALNVRCGYRRFVSIRCIPKVALSPVDETEDEDQG